MVKVIFIDIDGTLRDSNRNLSKRTIDSVKKVTDKGILLYCVQEDLENIQNK